MVRLKNIHKSGGHIFCDAYVEDCVYPVALDFDIASETLAEYHLPRDYDYCTSHIAHAKWYLLSAESNLPAEKLIMWY